MEEIANSCAAESVAPLTRAVIHCVPDNNTTAEAPVETLRQTAPVVPTRKTCTCESLGRTCPHCIRKARWERALKKLKWVTRGLSHEDASFLFPEHWLEAVDTKHRVGSGLNHYFTSWLRSSTTQDFFTWLDDGQGATVDLPHYPRQMLESNRVTYLDEKQRKKYAVYVADDGKLVYRQSGDLVNTEGGSLKTKRGSTWIYVMSTDKTVYIAKKERGVFHHSSFLGGACVIAAGRITVDHGLITGIAPHSGHYRTSPEQFTRMLKYLKDMGVDMSQTQVEWVKEHDKGFKRYQTKRQRRASQLAALNGEAPIELLVQTRMVDIDENAPPGNQH